MLAGLELPTEGTVAFDEDDVTVVPAAERDIVSVLLGLDTAGTRPLPSPP